MDEKNFGSKFNISRAYYCVEMHCTVKEKINIRNTGE